MQRFLLLWLSLLTTVLSVGCDSLPASFEASNTLPRLTEGKLTITGSSTLAPLVAEIGKRFEQRFPGTRIDVQTGGSGKGIADARSGVADIGMASRPLKSEEADLIAHRIAADGVSLIVHADNTVHDLTRQQVIDIYTGRITNWRAVGGADLPITVVHKAEGRATLEVFLEHYQLSNPMIRADVIVGDNQHGVKTVAGAAGAIGYVSIGTAEADAAAGVPIRLLPVDSVAANSNNVAAGTFPISRPLVLVTADLPSPLAQRFIDFCQSEEVHDLVVAQYFVPLEK